MALDIPTIASCARVRQRLVWYVIEHEMFPGITKGGEGHGNKRDFSFKDSFILALMAVLLDHGVKRSEITGYICYFDRVFNEARVRDDVTHLELAGKHMARFVYKSIKRRGCWRELRSDALMDASYSPAVSICVDIRSLYDRLVAAG